MRKLTTDDFKKKAISIHGDKYSYELSVYTHSLNYLSVECPIHGVFEIRASNHINNKQGCPKCGINSVKTKNKTSYEELLKSIKKLERYSEFDFSLIPKDFKTKKDKVSIVCKKHGLFQCQIRDIFRSKYCGCKKCRIDDDRHDSNTFIEKSKTHHGSEYDYSKVRYSRSHEDVIITCKEHGDFSVKAYIHVAGRGFCPKCTTKVSSHEIECANFLQENGLNVESTVRGIPNIYEIDILEKNKKVGIEINGLYWHSDLFKDKKYHIQKTKLMEQNNFRLIHIFEDEWVEKKEICKSRLKSLFDLNEKVYARVCRVEPISNIDANRFLNKNHIQGKCVSKIKLGLFLKDELVAVSTFGKRRLSLGVKKASPNDYELLRYCSKNGVNVIGGAGKLLKYFEKTNNVESIVSYCDIRWGSGKLYEKLGFSLLYKTGPNYFYTKSGKRFNRFQFRKDKLVSLGYDDNKTEKQIMKELGYNRIYDCGHYKFIKRY